MRISDWSSDVCSSDLGKLFRPRQRQHVAVSAGAQGLDQVVAIDPLDRLLAGGIDVGDDHRVGLVEAGEIGRARVGKECVSTCRSRWSQDIQTKKQKIEITVAS